MLLLTPRQQNFEEKRGCDAEVEPNGSLSRISRPGALIVVVARRLESLFVVGSFIRTRA